MTNNLVTQFIEAKIDFEIINLCRRKRIIKEPFKYYAFKYTFGKIGKYGVNGV